MSANATATAPQTEPSAAPAAPDAAELAARAAVPAPEAKLINEAAAIMPPPVGKVDLPTPPITPPVTHAVAPTAEAANDALGGLAMRMEKLLSDYIGKSIAEKNKHGAKIDVTGADVTVELADSNPVTSQGLAQTRDVSVKVMGGNLNADDFKDILRKHPGLKNTLPDVIYMGSSEPSGKQGITLRFLGLAPNDIAEMLKPHTVEKLGTPITLSAENPTHGHCTGGAGCAHCAAPKTHADAAEVTAQTDAAVQPATPIAQPAPPVTAPKPEAVPELAAATSPEASATPAPAVEQPAVAEAKPEIQAVAPPVTQVAAPALHQGLAANAPTLQKMA